MQGIFRVEPDPYADMEGAAPAGGVLSQKVFALAHATTWGDPFGDPPTTLLGELQKSGSLFALEVMLSFNVSEPQQVVLQLCRKRLQYADNEVRRF